MQIVKCRECGKEVSDSAKTCPHCGIKNPAPPRKSARLIGWAVIVAAIVGIPMCILSGQELQQAQQTRAAAEQAALTPAQRAAKAEQEQQFQRAVALARSLKAAMKDPSSFELTSAVGMAGDAFCFEYRAKNSFNATTTEQIAVNSTGKKLGWNTACGGKSGRDLSYIKHAL